MNKLSTEKRAAVIAALVEGNSLRATSRMTGVARMTVEKLLRNVGVACQRFHDATVRNVPAQRIQCDEIWSFCYAKKKNVTPEIAAKVPGAGDVWTWTAIDADTKLMVSFLVGTRNLATAIAFMEDVKARVSNRIQLTTDGFSTYLKAVDVAFGEDVDYAVLQKIYSGGGQEGRFSPPRFLRSQRATIKGLPDAGHISTSYVERQNLTMRMHMRRFTRLTNAFSKKIEMHEFSVALHFVHYNFCRVHQTLRVTPAMQAGLSDHPWELIELVQLAD